MNMWDPRYLPRKPRDLIPVDAKKLGNMSDGGDRRDCVEQVRNQLIWTVLVQTVIDDNSHVAYAEIQDNETAATAVGVLHRAIWWFADGGVALEKVLSDNGPAYKSHLWRGSCADLDINAKRPRPYRPQTNRKIDRFHRLLAAGWAFSGHYEKESGRRAALSGWIHEYGRHRPRYHHRR